jgi:Zn-finger nucleic acid-binding protein
MQCPVCKEVTLVMAERQNVEVDYCPKCRGIWLDRGELDTIIERTMQATRVSQRDHEDRDYPDDDHGDHGRGKRRRGGFLGDLLDFG